MSKLPRQFAGQHPAGKSRDRRRGQQQQPAPGLPVDDQVHADAQHHTANQGAAIADNRRFLKAGLREPALLKELILREKLTHFDPERIPERIVHACSSVDTARDVRGFAVKFYTDQGIGAWSATTCRSSSFGTR